MRTLFCVLVSMAVAAQSEPPPAASSQPAVEAVSFLWPVEALVEPDRTPPDAASLPRPRGPGVENLARGVGIDGVPENLAERLSFEGVDAVTSSWFTPPTLSRPNVAAGPQHLLVATVTDLDIYDKDGNSLRTLPLPLRDLYNDLGPNCKESFLPDALYDEAAERFVVVASSADLAHLCVAVSQSADPTGAWWLYQFRVVATGEFFDVPHAAIGRQAIFVGGVNFSFENTITSRLAALDKSAMYAGGAATIVARNLAPGLALSHPIHLHGFAQGTWPTSGPHYFVTVPNAAEPSIWQLHRWIDPFGGNSVPAPVTLDLGAAHGVAVAAPVSNPQLGSATRINGNDARIRDFEYRDGHGWAINHGACLDDFGNTVNCLQWARIDLAGGTLVEAGVLRSTNAFRAYGVLAVDRCGNLALGYARFSATNYPAAYVAGALAGDPPGSLRPEVASKTSTLPYRMGLSNRWGDRPGMTVGPDGHQFWYAGIYAKDLLLTTPNWGTDVRSFVFPSCAATIFADGFESGNTGAWSLRVP